MQFITDNMKSLQELDDFYILRMTSLYSYPHNDIIIPRKYLWALGIQKIELLDNILIWHVYLNLQETQHQYHIFEMHNPLVKP